MPPIDAGLAALLVAALGGLGACGRALYGFWRGRGRARGKADVDERVLLSKEQSDWRQELRGELDRLARRIGQQEAIIDRQEKEIQQLTEDVERLTKENRQLRSLMGVLDLHIDPSYFRPRGTPGTLAEQP